MSSFLSKRISEGYDDIQKIAVKMRVHFSDKPGTPNLQDVLTTLRGLPNVITVSQHGPLEPAGNNKQWVKVLVKFENVVAVDLLTLQNQMEKLPTVDLVSIKTVDGSAFDPDRADKEYKIARGPRGDAHAKEYGLGKYSLSENALRQYVRALILNIEK